jgi:hypothetical protein
MVERPFPLVDGSAHSQRLFTLSISASYRSWHSGWQMVFPTRVILDAGEETWMLPDSISIIGEK